MKAIKAFGLLASLGGLLIALNLGGVAGCGDDTGGGGGGGGSGVESESAAQAAILQSLFVVQGNTETSALQVAAFKSQVGCEFSTDGDSILCDCDNAGGTFTISGLASGESLVINYDSCIFESDDPADGLDDENELTGEAVIATISSTETEITFDDMTVITPECGTFVENGTIVTTIISDTESHSEIDITATSGSDTIQLDGSLDYTIVDANTTLTNGTLDWSGSFDNTCTFVDVNADICPEVADACGIDASDLCIGDDYNAAICSDDTF